MTELELYVDRAIQNERSQSSTFDLNAIEVQRELEQSGTNNSTQTQTGNIPISDMTVGKVFDNTMETIDKGVSAAKKEFKRLVTKYNDGNNTLICFMLFVIIILMIFDIFLD